MKIDIRTKAVRLDDVEAPTEEARELAAWALLMPWVQRVKRECDLNGWKMGGVKIEQLVVPEGPPIHRGIDRQFIGMVQITMLDGDNYCNYCGSEEFELTVRENGQTVCDMCEDALTSERQVGDHPIVLHKV